VNKCPGSATGEDQAPISASITQSGQIAPKRLQMIKYLKDSGDVVIDQRKHN